MEQSNTPSKHICFSVLVALYYTLVVFEIELSFITSIDAFLLLPRFETADKTVSVWNF